MGVIAERLLLAGAGLALCVALGFGWQLARIERWNAAIAAGRVAPDEAERQPRLRFAAAYALGGQGKIQEALNAYRELAVAPDATIRRDAKFNSGNLYLQQALAARADPKADASAVLTLMELAKQSYRDVLREDSGDWDARYNLEAALRLDPDPDEESPELSPPPARHQTPTVGLGTDLGLP